MGGPSYTFGAKNIFLKSILLFALVSLGLAPPAPAPYIAPAQLRRDRLPGSWDRASPAASVLALVRPVVVVGGLVSLLSSPASLWPPLGPI